MKQCVNRTVWANGEYCRLQWQNPYRASLCETPQAVQGQRPPIFELVCWNYHSHSVLWSKPGCVHVSWSQKLVPCWRSPPRLPSNIWVYDIHPFAWTSELCSVLFQPLWAWSAQLTGLQPVAFWGHWPQSCCLGSADPGETLQIRFTTNIWTLHFSINLVQLSGPLLPSRYVFSQPDCRRFSHSLGFSFTAFLASLL